MHARQSYSQFGEDLLLRAWLDTVGKEDAGFYVDVGAHHPLAHSNTALLHQSGWRGINIEPIPELHAEFLKARPRDVNLNIGCARRSGEQELTIYNHPGASTMADTMRARQTADSRLEVTRTILVQVKSLSDVLNEHAGGARIDYVDVDAEGLDLEVLEGADLLRWQPTIVTIEDHTMHLFDIYGSEVARFMEQHGYTLVSQVMPTSFYLNRNR